MLTSSAFAGNALNEKNKNIVLKYWTMSLEGQVKEAYEKYVVADAFLEHNPLNSDNIPEAIAFWESFVQEYPQASVKIERIIAEDNLVAVHSHWKLDPSLRGEAVMDFFRVEDGKIVEHWDVIQAVPEQALNTNTMF